MLQKVQGHQLVVGLYEETVYGADPGSPTGSLIICEGFGVKASQGLQDDSSINGTRGVEKPEKGNIEVGGPMTVKIAPTAIGTLLKHAIGAVATTGTGPYTHTYTAGDLPVGLVLERDRGAVITDAGRYEKLNGNKVGTIDFSFPQEGFPSIAFNMKGANASQASAPLDATLTDNGYTPFNSAEGSIKEGGVASAVITEASFSLNNSLDEAGFSIGAQTRQDLDEGMAIITGSLTAMFKDMTLLNKAINDTASSVEFTMTRGDGLGSASNESLVILLQNLKYEWDGDAVEGPGGVMVTLPFKGYKSGADLGIQAVLKNALATV